MLFTRLTTITFLVAAGFWISEAEELYDVACPGENSVLRCTGGQVIQVQNIEYGLQSTVNCNTRAQPAQDASSDCINPGMLTRMKSICDNLEYCRLAKPHMRMFTCEASPDNFIQYTYVCEDRKPGERTVRACEGKEATLSCESGQISVVKANFGRLDENTCTADQPSRMTFCSSGAAVNTEMQSCEGASECTVEANEEDLGVPVNCDNLPKYLHVDYVCV